MAKTLEFLIDLVSPNAYLAWYPVKDLLKRTGAELKITPVFLGGIMKLTGNRPPMIANAGIKGKNEYFMLEMRRFQAKHALAKFAMNPHFPFMTIAVQRMMCAAVRDGRGTEFIELMLPHAWENGANLGDVAVLKKILAASDFDADAMAAAAGDAAIKAELLANTEGAVARGVFGIPSFFVGDELYFGKDRLDGVEDALG
ncbi:2-hydroxychromene-2-carboxylate isomerase [Pacificimonas sp. WHA3]|uniref:2-hydroxychromene-2-carboxylate isomerase n=1 Tax=Pacificimonas pallii TaxID=2827236 RepID=A0ABS6SAD8_9SPHN|nr:2-hydroxychromene-2-carboxylate isomerase [Pacificimonas pallii]MBV7255344.1 2-hydroxychromene-2-carboxylate isomerase [Pacificimonas pallii]